jgi:hypothetical protein
MAQTKLRKSLHQTITAQLLLGNMNFWKSKTAICVLVMFIVGLGPNPAHAQHDSNRPSSIVSALGIEIGYGDTYVDELIRGHPVFAAFTETPISKVLTLRVEGEYFQTKNSSPWVDFQYKGATYTAFQSQVWRNWSLGASVLARVSRVGRIGAGAGLEFISVHRVSYKSDWVFWVSFYEDDVSLIQSNVLDESEMLLRPSVFVMADFERTITSSFSLVAGVRYKLIFVGEKYGHTALNTQNTYGGSVGVKYYID